MKRLIVRLLAGLIVFLLGIEALLRLFDPLGIVYFANLELMNPHIVLSPTRGYMLSPGQYVMHTWTATELGDNTRLVPDNPGGACTLVFVGDSVTFGEGVSDGDTWVNLVARQLHSVNVLNAAFDAYNSENVRGTIADFPKADAIIYLIVGNDSEITIHQVIPGPEEESYSLLYALYLLRVYRDSYPTDYPRFWRDMDAMRADPRVTFVTFDYQFGPELTTRYPVRLIPPWTHNISRVDGHANIEGNQQIAAGMLPIAQAVVKDKCGG